MLCRLGLKTQRSTTPLARAVHSRHFPNEKVIVNTPKPEDFDKIRHLDEKMVPFYGGRIRVERVKKQRFPQVIPVLDTTPIDIRPRQMDKTLRFGGNPATYPTMLVYPDGSTITIPYHKPVGTLYLPGEDKEIRLGPKVKAKPKRRVKVGVSF